MASNIFNIKNGVVASGSVVFPNLITASNATNVLMLSGSQVYYATSSIITPIAVTGSTLYSVNPLSTPNPGTDNNILLGGDSGYQSLTASYATCIGYQSGYISDNISALVAIGMAAGWKANRVFQSSFIGIQAGAAVSGAFNSVFIGPNAGSFTSGSDSSILIGLNAGFNTSYNKVNSIGRNNIIIGTNITLPAGAKDSINLGGIIFASNTYSTITGDPSPNPSGGKIGINTVSPTYNFEVSGTVGFPNLTTSSTTVSNVVMTNNSGQLFITASSAFGGGGTGAGFPYSGSAVITGSLLVSGSNGVTVSGSLSTTGDVTLKGITRIENAEWKRYPLMYYESTKKVYYEDFKWYSAIISQDSTNEPTVNYLIANTTGLTLTWNKPTVTTGRYDLTTTSALFTSNKTAITLSPGLGDAGTLRFKINSETSISIFSYDSSFTLSNSLINNAVIDIKIYSI